MYMDRLWGIAIAFHANDHAVLWFCTICLLHNMCSVGVEGTQRNAQHTDNFLVTVGDG
jgi:hypothetical protein